ncbi:MAG: GNAT family N-acetyltransferase [Sarcina sp.]
MVIERLKTDDIPQLVDLYFQLVDRRTDINLAVKKYEELLENDNYYVIIAKENGEVIGSVLAIICESLALDTKPFLVIEDVIVKEGIRGKGIGTALMEEADKFAISRECVYAILVSSGYRKSAHAFYEKAGYTEDVIGFRKGY